jgi:hypothetical protein
MKTTDRTLVYFGGFILGMMLVSLIMSRRTTREQANPDPWLSHNAAMVEAGADPLPEGVPASIEEGLIIDYGLLPDKDVAAERVWLMKFEGSYPNVRVVESIEGGLISYMAADQIKVEMADGVDVTELKPMLDKLGLHLRMFNRKEKIAVVGVLNTQIDAVPATIEAIQPWAHLYDKAEPDWILFKGE